ncbi:MAG TPA: hypothetical protein VH589_17070 [Trebonia sp.]
MNTARRRVALASAVGVVALAVLGFAAFEITGKVTAQATLTTHKAHGSQTATAAPPATPTSQATASPVPTTASPATTASPTAPRVQTIVPVSAVAFGPNGTADGDDPQDAGRVLTGSGTGWTTQWYATPNFGDLKPGTGLLLDMGRTVTITSVRLSLGSQPGAEVQLRLGTSPDSGSLRVVTTATATGQQLSLPLTAPASARYVLVWFTRLPPNGSGTYQVFLHSVTVQGQP